MNYQSFIISLVLSGALGFTNYSLLVNSGIFSVYAEKYDKLQTCIIFSAVNFGIFSFLSVQHKLTLFLAIIITVLISIIITWIFSVVYNLYFRFTNKSREKSHLSFLVKQGPREEAFSYNGYIYAIIFDFDSSLIAEGYLKRYSDAKELENQLLLMPASYIRERKLTENDALEILNSELTNDNVEKTYIYIDSNSKLKYFLIFYPEEEHS